MVEDIIQDVFLKLWSSKEQLTSIENLDAYLVTLSKNQLINLIRRRAKESDILAILGREGQRHEINNATENLTLTETKEKLSATIEKLPHQQKVAFYLSRQANLKHEDIASIMQISKNTVRNHIIQAMRTLKKSLTSLLVSVAIHFFIFLGCTSSPAIFVCL
ncbi:sigma-70 family RNA polymerase sigma factor [Niabella hibiscisoli]|uniref:sigma-70 family RNA polymerase sigma factor n=1 Tax=Niabella hibiscisoli TaxID=1825928 RepID=UPI001F0E3314|nr:sigma-70 family RNA polymerase sigma factor [Niabella hibiscisoli]MCH5717409.1 sigma-70 family RNA polymerase sigma factor [Niabella hibiscisoli]